MVRVIYLFYTQVNTVDMDIRFDGKRALVTGAGRGRLMLLACSNQ